MDLTSKAVTEVLTRTIEYLQPNPGECLDFSSPLPSAPQFSKERGRGGKEASERTFLALRYRYQPMFEIRHAASLDQRCAGPCCTCGRPVASLAELVGSGPGSPVLCDSGENPDTPPSPCCVSGL